MNSEGDKSTLDLSDSGINIPLCYVQVGAGSHSAGGGETEVTVSSDDNPQESHEDEYMSPQQYEQPAGNIEWEHMERDLGEVRLPGNG